MRFSKRKWGWYLTLISRKRFKVKLLRFHRGIPLSKQYHNHRSELWLFLSGCGNLRIKNMEFQASSGTAALINPIEIHQYKALKPTWVLEIQFAEYDGHCNEEDIVRL